MTTQELVDQFKSSLVRIGTDGVMTYLTAQIPFFSLPIVRYFTKIIVENIISIVVNYTELGVYFIHIDLKTAAQAKDFEQAAKLNKEAPSAESRQKLIDAARKLISLRG